MTSNDFLALVLENSFNKIISERLAELELPQAYLVAGCLFQTIWNLKSDRAVTENIKDYDVFYFDDADLSYDAEDEVIQQVGELCEDLPVEVEVRNQARVHLWYPEHFGYACPALKSSREGIDRYLVLGTCLGVSVAEQSVYAPHGFTDLEEGILRPNPINNVPDLFKAKALSYQKRWPWLTILGSD